MGKKLSETSLEELWQLFPIILMEHKSDWKSWYVEEESRIRRILSKEHNIWINHIGSTAIDGIWAKPIVDVLIEIEKEENMGGVKELLVQNGYVCMSQNEERMSFNKGYTEDGFADRVFHLHLRYVGDNDEIYFRDYLKEHPTILKEYEELKLGLWKKYEHNRDGYTDAKADFVEKYTEIAKNNRKV